MPTIYILAGANGSGKSTLYQSKIQPNVLAPFINADIIQKEELKNPDPTASYEAAQIAARRRDQYMAEKKSFVTETVFSHESKLKLVTDAQEAGFYVVLYHVGLANADLNVDRVSKRVKEGGHDVPEDKIRARRERGETLICAAARLADHAFVYDNSNYGKAPTLGIQFARGKVVSIGNNLTEWQRDVYAQDLQRFSAARLNPAAASYEVIDRMAKEQSQDANARAQIPRRGQTYTGKLVGQSAMHTLQKTNDGKYVAHFTSTIGKNHRQGTMKTITYKTQRKVTVKDVD